MGTEKGIGATSARPKTHVPNASPYFFRRADGAATIFLFQPQTPGTGDNDKHSLRADLI